MPLLTLALTLGIIAFQPYRRNPTEPTLPLSAFIAAWDEDPESELARGGKLNLACADLFSLELIPGIGDTSGNALLNLVNRVPKHPVPLTNAHGIGDKTAQKLSRYLTVAPPCAGRRGEFGVLSTP